MFSPNMHELNLCRISKTVFNGFTRIVNEFKRKPIKLWVDQRRQFYNNLMQKLLDDNDLLIYLTHNEGKCQ